MLFFEMWMKVQFICFSSVLPVAFLVMSRKPHTKLSISPLLIADGPCMQAVPHLWRRGSEAALGPNSSDQAGERQDELCSALPWGVPAPVRHSSCISYTFPAFNSPPPSCLCGIAVLKGKPLQRDALGVKLTLFQHGVSADPHFNTLLLGIPTGWPGGASPRVSEIPTQPPGLPLNPQNAHNPIG